MDRNIGYSLYEKFKSLYAKAHNGNLPSTSVHAASSMFKRIAGDVGEETARDLIIYYFENRKLHDFIWFTYNYHVLIDEMAYKAKDEDKRRRVREATKKRIEELGISLENNLVSCAKCGSLWTKEEKKGRPFKYCPDCRKKRNKSQEELQLTLKED